MSCCHVLLTVGLLLLGLISVDGNGDYTDQFAVELEGGEDVAQLVAGSYGFKLERKVSYLLEWNLHLKGYLEQHSMYLSAWSS